MFAEKLRISVLVIAVGLEMERAFHGHLLDAVRSAVTGRLVSVCCGREISLKLHLNSF